jgi:hypothetical protein
LGDLDEAGGEDEPGGVRVFDEGIALASDEGGVGGEGYGKLASNK